MKAAAAAFDLGDDLNGIGADVLAKSEADETAATITTSATKLWKSRRTLRSHFDGVRALAWHPTDPVLVSGSDDATVKVWALKGATGSKKSALDVDPMATFRGHTGSVFTVSLAAESGRVYSAGADGMVLGWELPTSSSELYGPHGRAMHRLAGQWNGHSDAIWSLEAHPSRPLFVTGSADGTVRIWDGDSPGAAKSIVKRENGAVPTALALAKDDWTKVVVSYTSVIATIDLETGRVVSEMTVPGVESGDTSSQVNALAIHPTLPLLASGHEDKRIRWFDMSSGACVSEMTAHLDSVSTLDMDPSGLFLVSGGHDASLRLWDVRDKGTMLQEVSIPHRKQFDEAVYDVKCHPSRPLIASSGADSNIKLYQ